MEEGKPMTPMNALEQVLHDWGRVYSGRDPDEVLEKVCAGLALTLIDRPELRRHVQEHRTDRLRPAPGFVKRLAGITRRLRDASLGRLAAEDPDVASFLVRHPHVIPALLKHAAALKVAAAAVASPGATAGALPPPAAAMYLTSHALYLGHAEFTPAEGAGGGAASGTLLQRARAGEADAWQGLAQLLVPLIYHWCRAAGLPEGDARQLAPQVFQKAQAEIGTSRPEGPFRPWLRTLTAACVAEYAARQGRSTVALEGTAGIAPGGAESEAKLVIERALELFAGAFDEPAREVGRRMLVRGEPLPEVARALNRGPEQVHALHERARGTLEQLVGDLIE